MILDDLIGFLKKKGFRDTFQVLTQAKNNKCEKHEFYNELNKFSYYNSYFRVKENLLKKGLISIKTINKKKHIQLTKKGLQVYNKLIEINDLIGNHS